MAKRRGKRWGLRMVVTTALVVGAYFTADQFLTHPDTPLPASWNPTEPLAVTAAQNPMTLWKLRNAMGGRDSCLAALESGAIFQSIPDQNASPQCHIRNNVRLRKVSGANIRATDTRCDLALTMAMWVEHGVQPAAQKHFGMPVRAIRTQGSYNCRQIFGTKRMSKHSQAKAIDVAGFTLASGRDVELIKHWDGTPQEQAFLRDVRDAACDWFSTTLGPDYNRAHADHFHLQSEGWGTCR